MTPDISKTLGVLPRVFGIVSFSPAVKTTSNIQDMSHLAQQLIQHSLTGGKSFALRVTRVGNHSFTSQDVAVKIGHDIGNATHARVDLVNPDVELFIEIRDKYSYVFTEKIQGAKGLPLGTQGRVLVLIDTLSSVLAAWYLMHRGCTVLILNMNQTNENAIGVFLSNWYADSEILFIDPTSKEFNHQLIKLITEKKCDAIVTGHTLKDPARSLSEIAYLKKIVPVLVLSPLVALTDHDIDTQCKERGIFV